MTLQAEAEKIQADINTVPAHSIEQFARMFVAEHGDGVRYCPDWDAWMIWDGTRWAKDTKMKTFNMARKICMREARKANDGRLQRSIASPATWEATLKAVRGDLAVLSDEWDRQLYLLNTPGGTVDLRSGEMKVHSPADYITKITKVTPKKADSPVWSGHLNLVLNEDAELIAYLQRFGGYCLTGYTKEKQFAFAWGTGDNGKSMTFNTWYDVMGDYAMMSSIETFTATKNDQHPTGLATFHGARLVLVSETESGKSLRESIIKQITGGDAITARFMRQDFFQYLPQFKLVMFGNHKPPLRSVNEAMRTRIHLVPFIITIREKDKGFREKLAIEERAILAWMIEGAREWFKTGLNPPKAVVDATNKYLDEQDKFGMFCEDCLDLNDPNAFTSTREILRAQNEWAEAQNEWKMRERDLVEELESKSCRYGKRKVKINGGSQVQQQRGFFGVQLCSQEVERQKLEVDRAIGEYTPKVHANTHSKFVIN